jgi:hypothetical protein
MAYPVAGLGSKRVAVLVEAVYVPNLVALNFKVLLLLA